MTETKQASVTEGQILDHLAMACKYAKIYGEVDVVNYWYRQMSAQEHVAFDLCLVRMSKDAPQRIAK